MRVFKEIKTNGYVFFGKASLDLDHKGVTVIQAINKDARKDSSSTNGAGKSLLMGLIPEIFFDSVPSGKDVKAPKMAKKSGSLTMQVKDDTYVLDRSWGKKKSFEITKNGNPTKVRTLAIASERARQLIGLTEEEFYTTAYIDVNRNHPLIRGTSVHRRDYFTSLFRLGDTDSIRKLLLSELSECEKAGSTYKELVATFKSLKGETGAANLELLRSRATLLGEAAKDYIKVSAAYNTLLEEREFKDNYAKLIAKVVALCKPEAIEETLAEAKKTRKSLNRQLEDLAAYEAEQSQIHKAKSSVKAIHKELEDRGLTTDLEEAEKGHRKLARAEANYEVGKASQVECENAREQIIKDLAGFEDAAHKRAQKPVDKDKKKALELEINQLEHALEHSRKFGKGVCPTCGQDVKARSTKEIKEELRALEARLSLWVAAHNVSELQEELRQVDKKLKELKGEDLETLEGKIKKYRKLDKAYSLLSRIVQVPKASIDPPTHDRETLERRQERNAKSISLLEQAEPLAKKIGLALKWSKQDDKTMVRLKAEMDALESSARKREVILAQIESETEKIKQLRDIRDRAMTLKAKAADVPVIKALLEIYSNKGLKKLMIQRYASVIEEQLNKFRSVMFSEDFTFEIIYDSQFHILVHRKYGKKTVTSDVRKLSGAEGRGFTLLLLLATLTLIPKSRRLNFLVLDEADSNMGPDMLKNFQRFIPILNKVIPHIVVVTPKPDVEYDNARYFTVVKENGRSKLMKGRPSTWHSKLSTA